MILAIVRQISIGNKNFSLCVFAKRYVYPNYQILYLKSEIVNIFFKIIYAIIVTYIILPLIFEKNKNCFIFIYTITTKMPFFQFKISLISRLKGNHNKHTFCWNIETTSDMYKIFT